MDGVQGCRALSYRMNTVLCSLKVTECAKLFALTPHLFQWTTIDESLTVFFFPTGILFDVDRCCIHCAEDLITKFVAIESWLLER